MAASISSPVISRPTSSFTYCSKYGIFLPGVIRGRDTFVANLKRAEEEFEALDGEILQILVEGAAQRDAVAHELA